MACDHGMMLMSDHDDAYVDAMLMVNMQANTRSVTPLATNHALFLVTTLVPITFCSVLSNKDQTSFLVKLFSSSCMEITQFGCFKASSTLSSNMEETKE